MFGTAAKKEKLEDSPGPGSYEPREDLVHARVPDVLIAGTEERHSYIDKSGSTKPGPG